MSSTPRHRNSPADGVSIEHRLARLLESTTLGQIVPHLPPETLHGLIRHRGLEACGELIAAATPAQLTTLLDLDLWRHPQPGRDEVLDVERFGEWLEVLADTGSAVAARLVAGLDTDIVVAGLSRYVRVFDPGIFEPTAHSDDEHSNRHEAMREGDAMRLDRAPSRETSGTGQECELGGYLVRARRGDAWDAIVALLAALESEHGACFHTVMQGCRRLSNSSPEADGLDDLLLGPEQHLYDVMMRRQRRQAQQGYATPADARAFLALARQPHGERRGSMGAAQHPIVASYFRGADSAPDPLHAATEPPHGRSTGEPADARAVGTTASLEAVLDLLTEAGVMPQRARGLLEAPHQDPQVARLTHLRRLLAAAHAADDTGVATRSRELAFLANVLLAGCSLQSRPFTPQEASDAAAGICNLGLECLAVPVSALPAQDLVSAFEVGWATLHRGVSLMAADQLLVTIAGLRDVDRDLRLELAAMRRALAVQREAGTPWRARGAVEVLALLDPAAWVGVAGLLEECPIIPAALTAVLDGRTTPISATEFEFFSTTAQIAEARRFMERLPAVLSR